VTTDNFKAQTSATQNRLSHPIEITRYIDAVAGCLVAGQKSIFTICSHLMHETSDKSQDGIVQFVWVVSATMFKMEDRSAGKATVTYSCALNDAVSLNSCCV